MMGNVDYDALNDGWTQAAMLDALTEARDAALRTVARLEAELGAERELHRLATEHWERAEAQCLRYADDLRTEHERAERLVKALETHWLFGIECDHSHRIDKPCCACAEIDLGWYLSVGDAVKAWVNHVETVVWRTMAVDALTADAGGASDG